MSNKIWIFEYLDKVSDSYHGYGGLIVIAKDLESAKLEVGKHNDVEVPDEEWDEAIQGSTSLSKRVIAFPNAGCC